MISSDVECSNCREAAPLQFKLFEKYKDKVRFGYSKYSENANLGIKALEAAAKQNKFWEIYNKIIEHPFSFDTLNYVNFAFIMQIDTIQFKKDLRDENLTKLILKNLEYLQKKKIFATHSLLINKRIIPDIFNEDQIIIEIESC
jgi:protein-disulfide isomerase